MAFKMDYVEVKDRIPEFWEQFPNGRIINSDPEVITIGDRTFIKVTTETYRTNDPAEPPASRASSFEPFPGTTNYTKNSEAENAETSAMGRALGALGIGIGKSIATADEVRTRRAEQEPISDAQRTEVNEAIAALDDNAKKRLREQWKARRIRRLEELTAADLDGVHELIVEVATAKETAA